MTAKIGFLFPGQGAQYIGMGKDLFDSYDYVKSIYAEANKLLGYDLQKICFEGPEDELTRTKFAQPAIFVTSYAALCVLKENFPAWQPSFFAGLSLGEFSALVAAEAISFEAGLKLVQKRADAMEASAKSNPGTMASIMGLDQAACELLAQEAGCEVANLNAPDQIVLSGTQESIEKACLLAPDKGAKRAIPLKVGGAFHSSLMREAKASLEEALRETEIRPPSGLFVPNAKAEPVSEPSEIRTLLASQLMSSVRWVASMDCAFNNGIKEFVEVGPGKVLKGLARRCNKELSVQSFGTIEDVNKYKEQPLFT